MWRKALLLSLLLSLDFPGAAWARPENPHLARGIRLLDQAKDERALAVLEKALGWRENGRDELARIHFYLGVTRFNLAQPERARAHFEMALEIDPGLRIPADLSPKILRLVEKVRTARAKRPPPSQPPSRAADPLPRAVPPPSPATGDRPAARSRTSWPAWVTLGIALAAGGVGVGLGAAARRDANEANDLGMPHDEAQAMHDRAGRFALTANILYGTAAAAAVAAGVLFLVGRSRPGGPRAGLAPLPGGALVQIDGVRW